MTIATTTTPAHLFTLYTRALLPGADLEFMVEACSLSDVCIFFLGASMVGANRTRVSPTGNPYSGFDVILPATEGEGWDRNDLLLPGEQLSLVQVCAILWI